MRNNSLSRDVNLLINKKLENEIGIDLIFVYSEIIDFYQ
ncbi:hypothetical protein J2T02_004526 [Chitinophaga terrae (ex Kim and Jung 2007)]|nr:hypothetical protein [Chitinophaga terrae (ex Kim and Jung 2007)]